MTCYLTKQNPLIPRLREIFPYLEISLHEGQILTQNEITSGLWNYEMLAPEQQLDTLVSKISMHFNIKGIKCPNGKTD